MADEEQMRLIVDNLISNAAKYASENGEIKILLYGKDGKLVLEVEDSGPGIEEQDKNMIFDAFYKGNPPEKGVIQGSGLGLSIVKEFVEAHKGKIELVNDNPDAQGAHFRISLPVVNEDKELAWAV